MITNVLPPFYGSQCICIRKLSMDVHKYKRMYIAVQMRICDACGSNMQHVFVIVGFGFGGTAGASQTGIGGLGGLAGGLATGQPAVDATAAVIAQQNQQQLLQLTSSPYGDSPLFHNLRQVMQFCTYLLYCLHVMLAQQHVLI